MYILHPKSLWIRSKTRLEKLNVNTDFIVGCHLGGCSRAKFLSPLQFQTIFKSLSTVLFTFGPNPLTYNKTSWAKSRHDAPRVTLRLWNDPNKSLPFFFLLFPVFTSSSVKMKHWMQRRFLLRWRDNRQSSLSFQPAHSWVSLVYCFGTVGEILGRGKSDSRRLIGQTFCHEL